LPSPKVTRVLESFADSNNTFLSSPRSANPQRHRGFAGKLPPRADQDPFVAKALQRAFVWCMQQSGEFRSDPLALAPDDRPAFVVAVPLKDINGNFTGMLAAVVSLDPLLHRLQDASGHQRSVFIVDHSGHVVTHPDTKNFVPGTDLSNSDLIKQIHEPAARATQHNNDPLHPASEGAPG